MIENKKKVIIYVTKIIKTSLIIIYITKTTIIILIGFYYGVTLFIGDRNIL